MKEFALQVENITVYYEKSPVLWEISLSIPCGRIVGIIGPNGAGKSTFLKTLLGLVKPTTGSIAFFNQPYKKVQKRVAYVPQKESVDWDFPIRVIDVALMGYYGKLGLFRWPSKQDKQKAKELLEKLGILSFASRQISQLSGGQQQRLFLVRALLQEADIYLLDEPFSGIDITTETLIMEMLRELRNQGKTILIVHHNLSSAVKYFDYMVMLNRRVMACGELSEVFNRDNLEATYGNQNALLEEVAKLSKQKSRL